MKDVWIRLQDHIDEHRAIDGQENIPFWGGLVGYISYEAGLETIDVKPPSSEEHYPDLWFVSIERSIVVDHVLKKVYVQSIRRHDAEWIARIRDLIQQNCPVQQPLLSEVNGKEKVSVNPSQMSTPATGSSSDLIDQSQLQNKSPSFQISGPSQAEYCDKVRRCQEHIRAGSSYELCLTDQTLLRYPPKSSPPSPWSLYRRLRSSNPAPFSAYLNFSSTRDNLSIMSSSPERFLSWTRSNLCQFRPIKGTVNKTPTMTRDLAETILKSRKEQAENLMIVDLIRHDLHGVIGSQGVEVKQLMKVEEYETVYQLVSVIEGQIPVSESEKTGFDVLKASLPPGSMTGAPKKRSCEILREVEGNRPRGVYGGVLGYLDVGGGGDFSVVIRTAVKWRDGLKIGAGGAVTVLSSPEGEWEEMLAKRDSLAAILT